uniref:NADH dehydrogenase subunit 4 n=1 Tax=Dentathalia scutellariae TaxID=1170499 RepID=UPI00220E52D8|nr:NADH dehydrogenase subunit 4 [Dentathalia scutellariae]UXW93342.1 NADH dehydrogenase subunit 4 [Dentathalia scutellariae]
MLKILFFLGFMFPLVFVSKFWVFQFFLILLSLLFMFVGSYSYDWMNLNSCLGCDLLSFGLILLTFWICFLMFLASFKIYEMSQYLTYFKLVNFMLILFLFLTFSSVNLFMFYLFFECSLIPILCLILGWGFQFDRLQASIYLLFYTLFASFPFLICIIFFYLKSYSLNFIYFSFNYFNFINFYVYLFMIFAFLVKMPMFLVHLWLPKAHVEAPICGSMILAGVTLKLGGYGLLRVLNILVMLGSKFNYFFIVLSLIGGVIVSLICLVQVDLKSLVAYSSVVHMGLLLGGLFTLTSWGLGGSYLLMISHGLCSSGLFCLINIVYERLSSRSLMINKGLINFMPSLTLWWFLLCSSNMAAPPSLNLLGEIFLINSLIMWNEVVIFLLILLSFFSASYSIYLYALTQHGVSVSNLFSFSQPFLREYMLLISHWIPLNFLILNSELFILWIC